MTIRKKVGQVARKASRSDEPPVEIFPVASLPSIMAALIYGRSGTGKTTVAATFPKPLLLLDIREKGWDSVTNVPDCDISKITEWEQFEALYWYLKRGKHRYRSVVIDQVTQLQDLALRKAMKDEGKEESDAISRRVFGQASGMMKTWLLNYRDLIDEDINVVFLAHDRATEGEDGGDDNQIDPSVGPRLMPSVASFLCGAVKVIGNTYIREQSSVENKRRVKKISYAMRIGPHAYYITKTRTPVGVPPPQVIADPSYDKLAAVMLGKYSDQAASTSKRK